MSFFIRALGAVLVIAAAACNTPSVPIPPPSPELMSFAIDVDAGAAQFEYEANSSFAEAIVYVFNRDVGVGIIDTARIDGSVGPTDPFPAEDGDEIVVTFELEAQLASTCVRVAPGQSSSANECLP